MAMGDEYQTDIELVQRIGAVPSILDVVCRTTGMGFAAVARVTEGRWIACGVRDHIDFGLKPGEELKVETTICHEIRQNHQAVIIDHVAESEAFRNHPTPAMYGFQSYISMPIILPDGSFFGTLCAIDPKPRDLNSPGIVGMFKLFAELIGFQIDAARRLEATEAKLLDAHATSELREQFIAVLGHDLRNPLAAISGGTRLIAKTPLNDKALSIVGLIQSSVVRMSALIDNVMDFARGRLGSGLTLNRTTVDLRPALEQVVAELRIIAPERAIETNFDLRTPVDCDPLRIAQLFSNLLGNALTHGATETPIAVRAVTSDIEFELSVSNGGEQIPTEAVERLFQPFYRGNGRASQQGLGLGLFIASQIARAHQGTLTVSSERSETRFTLRIPLVQP